MYSAPLFRCVWGSAAASLAPPATCCAVRPFRTTAGARDSAIVQSGLLPDHALQEVTKERDTLRLHVQKLQARNIN